MASCTLSELPFPAALAIASAMCVSGTTSLISCSTLMRRACTRRMASSKTFPYRIDPIRLISRAMSWFTGSGMSSVPSVPICTIAPPGRTRSNAWRNAALAPDASKTTSKPDPVSPRTASPSRAWWGASVSRDPDYGPTFTKATASAITLPSVPTVDSVTVPPLAAVKR